MSYAEFFRTEKQLLLCSFKQKVEERADPGLLLAVWLAAATCRWKAAQTRRSMASLPHASRALDLVSDACVSVSSLGGEKKNLSAVDA